MSALICLVFVLSYIKKQFLFAKRKSLKGRFGNAAQKVKLETKITMRYELWILLIAGVIAYDTYTDGQISGPLLYYTKYSKLAAIIAIAVIFIYAIKKISAGASAVANNDVALATIGSSIYGAARSISQIPSSAHSNNNNSNMGSFGASTANMLYNGITSSIPSISSAASAASVVTGVANHTKRKRSVSESRKKFVAANQQWRGEGCSNMLDHTFEIDHRVRLEYGGSNEPDNLVAMCRNCHGKKTAAENM